MKAMQLAKKLLIQHGQIICPKFLDLGLVVEIPSIRADDRIFDQDDLHGSHLHIKEVMVDSDCIDDLWKFIENRTLTVGRWVLTYDGPSDVDALNAVAGQIDSMPTVYILLRDVSIESLQVASSIDARNYIVDERFRGDIRLEQFLTKGGDVIFRKLPSSEQMSDA